MTTEQNKALLRRVIQEAFNKGNLAVVDELIAPNYVFHVPRNEVKGTEGFKQYITMMRTAFPDIHLTLEDMIAEGDKVVHRAKFQGTHKGDLMGIAPTGKQVSIVATTISRFVGGKEVEAWQFIDTLGFYQQLGVVPPIGPGSK
jgi:steroid delta-isomerase-like uncharacterized protein